MCKHVIGQEAAQSLCDIRRVNIVVVGVVRVVRPFYILHVTGSICAMYLQKAALCTVRAMRQYLGTADVLHKQSLRQTAVYLMGDMNTKAQLLLCMPDTTAL